MFWSNELAYVLCMNMVLYIYIYIYIFYFSLVKIQKMLQLSLIVVESLLSFNAYQAQLETL